MNAHHRQLKRELEQVGAKAQEIDKLTSIANTLRLLKPVEKRAGSRLVNILKPLILTASALSLGILIAVLAQSVSPTSWLYPIQKLSDTVVTAAHPAYRANVMMRRAQQVNELVVRHASSQVILSTLNSYQTEAVDYKAAPHANYSAFEYCKTNLEQAAAIAPANVREAIATSLKGLSNT